MNTTGIVAFAFGVPGTIRSNQRIAQIASRKARDLDAPVYTQLDVPIEPGVEVTYTDEEPGNPPPTLRMARGAVWWAKQREFRELWIVAAKPHLWRAIRDVEEALREAGAAIEVRACEKIEEYPGNLWFCPESTQKRVRSRKAWFMREMIPMLMPFFIYKRVAK